MVLKALAFGNRGENKDAYDLYYLMKYYGTSVGDVASRLAPLLAATEARQALEILERDFMRPDGLGPRRVADFLLGRPDDEIQADVVGLAIELAAACRGRAKA